MATISSRCLECSRLLPAMLRLNIHRLASTLQPNKTQTQSRRQLLKSLHTTPSRYAGHNRWSKIHRKKAIADMEKSKTIQKCVNLIINAIRTGGGSTDPDLNVRLASAIEQAKTAGVSKANVENAIRRATSKQDCGELAVFEGRGDTGYMLVIETITDNRNRTRPNLRTLLMKQRCTLGESGSSLFNFDHKGIIRVPCTELQAANVDPMDLAIEVEAEDVTKDDNSDSTTSEDISESVSQNDTCFQFKCEPKDLKAVSDAIKARSFSISSASLEYIPKTVVLLSQRDYNRALKVTNLLSDLDEVVEVFDNFALEN